MQCKIFLLIVTVLVVSNVDCKKFFKHQKSLEVTFEDVNITGYSMFTKKFEKTLKSATNIQEFLPEIAIDRLDIVNQTVPILYEGSIANMEDLDELIIEFSNLEEIKPKALSNLPQLRKLSLKFNKLEIISKSIFDDLPNLATLELNHNQISTISGDAFDNMPSLLNLNLADNYILEWNRNWFANTPLLTRISFQNNSLEKLPANAFKNLGGVKEFGSVSLKLNLIFSYNKISEIDPTAFDAVKEMNNLWLDNNELTDFNAKILKNTQVKDLRLNSNQISCFESEWKEVFKLGTLTHIDGNPFDCACLQKLKEWAKKNDREVVMVYSLMTCDAERIKEKLDLLEKRLKEIRGDVEDMDEKNP